MDPSQIVVVSNRGPVSFFRDDEGALATRRGGGGLASSLAPLLEGTGCLWVAAAMTDDDRSAAAGGTTGVDGIRLKTLDIDPELYAMAYDVVANSTLWFVYHDLFDLPRRPAFDRRWREAWEAFRRYNQLFAEAVAEEAPDGATVLVQDYHLALLGTWLRKLRPDLRPVHFSHTPFPSAESLRVLPDDVADELLEGMAGFDACGFHSARWVRSFEACFRDTELAAPRMFISPLAPDVGELRALIGDERSAASNAWIDERIGACKLILRVDRIELSKNVLRGFAAFDDLLEHRPEWRGAVVFMALLYPSREKVADYLAYRNEVESAAKRINARWSTPGWTPIVLDTDDDIVRSATALSRYDVLLVNPVRDGLNLVAMEGALVNERDGVIVLSKEAGAFDLLGEAVVPVHPFDVVGTSDALATALEMDPATRRQRAQALRTLSSARGARDWLDEQLAASGD